MKLGPWWLLQRTSVALFIYTADFHHVDGKLSEVFFVSNRALSEEEVQTEADLHAAGSPPGTPTFEVRLAKATLKLGMEVKPTRFYFTRR